MKKNLPLAILSGLLLWIAWPPTPYTTFLLFIGFVPMLLAIENIINDDKPKKGRRVFNVTFIGFFIWNSLSVYWVYNALKIVGKVVAIPITLIPYSLGPLLMATASCLPFTRTRSSSCQANSGASLRVVSLTTMSTPYTLDSPSRREPRLTESPMTV